jgi:two-component system, OmpR family, response regulator MtrA
LVSGQRRVGLPPCNPSGRRAVRRGRCSVQSRSVLELLAGPLVLCVGTSTEHFSAVAEATGGQVMMLYLPDTESVRKLLAGENGGEEAVPAVGEQADPPAHQVVECGKLRIDADLREATWHGESIPLSAREFDLLFALAFDPGRVWTFAELTTRVWNRPYLGDTDAVVSAVKRLRRQIRDVAASVVIESVRGVGYRLVAEDGTLLTTLP